MKSPEFYERRKALLVEGEMAERVGRFDWSTTPLGPAAGWSPSLRAGVHMMLASRFAMVLMWGPELTTLYNDALRPILSADGKHPRILGMPGRESWKESWPVVGTAFLDVLGGGPSFYAENQRVPLHRDGVLDHGYFTHSYSSLIDDDGTVRGVLVTVVETTQDVEHLEYYSEMTVQL